MTTITVGAGQQFGTLGSALAASHDGDTIAVQAGTYTDDFATITHSVTIQGVGGLAHFVSDTLVPNGKAILIDDAANLTINGLEFSGAQVDDGNGAGIRYEAGNLTIQNSYFHDNENGILGGRVAGGNVAITGSTFVHNGAGDGQTHGAYLGQINSLTVTNSFFQDQLGGSDVKSRAAFTDVEHNRFIDTDGSSDETNYQVDLPEGGNDTVAGNVVLKSGNPNNRAIIHFGGEIPNPVGSLIVHDNQFYSQRDPTVLVLNQSSGQPISIANNGLSGTVSIPVDGNTSTATISGSSQLSLATAPSTAILLPGSGGFSVAAGDPLAAQHAVESLLIDKALYLAQNPDVAAAGIDPVAHFEQYGWREGRAPDALFDVSYYLSHNPDVAASGMDPLMHYALYGWQEGRNPSAQFNGNGYLADNSDVKLAGMDPLQHYLSFGLNEGRTGF